MQLSFETFQKKYREAPEEIQVLIDSSRIPDLAARLATELGTPEDSIGPLVRILNRLVLDIITSETLPEYLTEVAMLTPEQVTRAVPTIHTSLSHITPNLSTNTAPPDTETTGMQTGEEAEARPLPKVTPLESRERLHLRPTAQTAAEAASWGSAPSIAPITRSHIRESLSPKRTMASDVAAARGEEQAPEEQPIPRYARPMTDSTKL